MTLDQLKLKKEGTYFTILAVLAAICWALAALVILLTLLFGSSPAGGTGLPPAFVFLLYGLVIALVV